MLELCPKCKGVGRVRNGLCPVCKGDGFKREQIVINVVVTICPPCTAKPLPQQKAAK